MYLPPDLEVLPQIPKHPELCLEPGSLTLEQFERLLPHDLRYLERLGFGGWHVYSATTCASGCSHCLICDLGCSADWGLYM